MIVAVVDGPERLYSEKLACPNDGTSIPQLEPRSFSFNSPYGACETCKGVGSTWAFDPVKVIPDPSKPLLEGGLGPGLQFLLYGIGPGELRRSAAKSISQFASRICRRRHALCCFTGTARFPGILKTLDENFSASERRLSGMADGVYVADPVPRLQRAAAKASEFSG